MAMAPDSKRIGELLIQEGVIYAEELQRAIEDCPDALGPLAAVLTECGHVTREALIPVLTANFKIPHLSIGKLELGSKQAELVPMDVATKHELVPLAKLGDILVVAKANYYNRAAVAELRRVTGSRVKVVQCDESEIHAALRSLYGPDAAPAPEPQTMAAEPVPAGSFMGGPGAGGDDALAATVVSEMPADAQTIAMPPPMPVARQPEPVESDALELQELPADDAGEVPAVDVPELEAVDAPASPAGQEEVLELAEVEEAKRAPAAAEEVVELSEIEEVKEAPADEEPVLVPEPADELQPVSDEPQLLEVPGDEADVLEEVPALEEVPTLEELPELTPEPVGPCAPPPYFEWPSWQAPPRMEGTRFKAHPVQREEVAAVQLAYKLDIQVEWDKLYTSGNTLPAIRMAK